MSSEIIENSNPPEAPVEGNHAEETWDGSVQSLPSVDNGNEATVQATWSVRENSWKTNGRTERIMTMPIPESMR
jgi:hypothetical protein